MAVRFINVFVLALSAFDGLEGADLADVRGAGTSVRRIPSSGAAGAHRSRPAPLKPPDKFVHLRAKTVAEQILRQEAPALLAGRDDIPPPPLIKEPPYKSAERSREPPLAPPARQQAGSEEHKIQAAVDKHKNLPPAMTSENEANIGQDAVHGSAAKDIVTGDTQDNKMLINAQNQSVESLQPPYLSVKGWRECVGKYESDEASHTTYCLPSTKPQNLKCSDEAFVQLVDLFQDKKCPEVEHSGDVVIGDESAAQLAAAVAQDKDGPGVASEQLHDGGAAEAPAQTAREGSKSSDPSTDDVETGVDGGADKHAAGATDDKHAAGATDDKHAAGATDDKHAAGATDKHAASATDKHGASATDDKHADSATDDKHGTSATDKHAASATDKHAASPSDDGRASGMKVIEHKSPDTDAMEQTNVMSYFLLLAIVAIIAYLVFHNKQKILALILEGRRRKPDGRRHRSAQYRKLDNNLEEAMGNGAGESMRNIIY